MVRLIEFSPFAPILTCSAKLEPNTVMGFFVL